MKANNIFPVVESGDSAHEVAKKALEYPPISIAYYILFIRAELG